MTWFAVINPGTLGTAYPITGVGGGLFGAFEWRITSTGKQEILEQQVSSLGTSTTTLTAGSYHAIAVQYNQNTGAWTFFVCASGTCTSDGSGTTSSSFTNTITDLGHNATDNDFKTTIAEIGYFNSATTTGVGAYASCKYGL